MIASHAHWFGHATSVMGMLHTPGSAIRGAVVICPPLGYESVASYRALCKLADQLAAVGLACMRIAYPGMGFGVPDEPGLDQVPVWKSAIDEAAAELRAMGAPWVGAVGLRFSATLAAEVAADGPLDALVAWDPVLAGRRYARGLQVLAAHTNTTTTTTDGVVVAGVEYASATLAGIRSHSFDVPAGVPTLVLQRAEPSSEAPITAEGVDVRLVSGTGAMLDVDAELSVVPTAVLDEVVQWLDQQAPSVAVAVGPPTTTSSTVHHSDLALRRECVRIGDAQVFALTTRREGSAPTHAVLFLDNGASPAFGPGGAWVDWADETARMGALAVQFDFSGLGESPAVAGEPENELYPPAAARNLDDVVRYLRAQGVKHVTAVGLCSGAVLAFDGAVQFGCIDHVVAINGRFDKPFTDRLAAQRAGGRTNRLLALPLGKAPLFPVFERTPTWLWQAMARLRLVALPTVALRRALTRGTRVSLVFGPREWGIRTLEHRDPEGWETIRRHSRCSVAVLRRLDHSMFDPGGRADVEAYLRRHVWPVATSCHPPLHPLSGATP